MCGISKSRRCVNEVIVFAIVLCSLIALYSCSDNPTSPARQDSYKILHFATQLTLLDQYSGKTQKLGGILGTAREAVYSPDGQAILAIDASGPEGSNMLYVSDLSGANSVAVEGSFDAFSANFSSDGSYIAFLKRNNLLSIHNRATGETSAIEPGNLYPEVLSLPVWLPDRNTFIVLVAESRFSTNRLFIEYDPATKTFEQISDSLNFSTDLSIASDGSFLIYKSQYQFHSDPRFAIHRLDVGEPKPQALLDCGRRRIIDVQLSPNGEWIAFLHETQVALRDFELYLVRSDGTDLKQLTDFSNELAQPAWRPDGEGIAFLGQWELSGRKMYYHNVRTGKNNIILDNKNISFLTWKPSISSGF